MITRTRANHAAAALLCVQTLNEIVCTSDFIRTYHLKILAFQVNFSLKFFREFLMELQRSLEGYSFERFTGGINIDHQERVKIYQASQALIFSVISPHLPHPEAHDVSALKDLYTSLPR